MIVLQHSLFTPSLFTLETVATFCCSTTLAVGKKITTCLVFNETKIVEQPADLITLSC